MLNFEEDMAVAPIPGLGLQTLKGFMPSSPGPARTIQLATPGEPPVTDGDSCKTNAARPWRTS